ncbi:MAG: DMT family transporter [Deltaproteobacteria bacterium]|nr:DMT family transporter [Deltaproteobacteria bacterium]
MTRRTHILLMDLLLLLVTFFWGATFIIVKSALREVDVTTFLTLRFATAFVLMAILFRNRILPLHAPTIFAGVVLGVFLWAAFAFQTWALTMISATNTALITGLSVAIVPILSFLLLRRPPAALTAIGVLLAFLGLYILTGGAPSRWRFGEFLVFLCAICVAFHILLTGYYAPRHDTLSLATWQLGTIALISLVSAGARGTLTLSLSREVWQAVVLTALFATVFAFAVQTYAQRITTPTRTALIFTGEPVFGTLFAHYYGGEPLLENHLLGGGLIFLGILLSQIRPGMWSKINSLGGRLNGNGIKRGLPSAPPSL